MGALALLPFGILLLSFVFLRLPLPNSSFIALLVSSLITETVFHASESVWSTAVEKTLILAVEIGMIILSAFFFVAVAKRAGVIDSIATLISNISSNRVVQGILVIYPIELMIEGSSGFGTPILMTVPILAALKFTPTQIAILPMLCVILAIPYGALGTPIRLGFPDSRDYLTLAHEAFLHLAPLAVITSIWATRIIQPTHTRREVLWASSLAFVHILLGSYFSQFGPEFAGVGPAFGALLYGLISSRFLFKDPTLSQNYSFQGIGIYGALIFVLWLGKTILMDQTFSFAPIRIFNPCWVFLAFGIGLIIAKKIPFRTIGLETWTRSKNTVFVFVSITFIVQQQRSNGSLNLLSASLPDWVHQYGVWGSGWLGSALTGASTTSNLLFSKVFPENMHPWLAAGTAIGVQIAFQSTVALRSMLHEALSEKEIYFRILPYSFYSILILGLSQIVYAIF